MATCDECGAASQRGLDCREQWDELISLEFSDVRAGAVHFLTVTCYQLQHPRAFPLAVAARDTLTQALADVVVRDRPVTDVRDEVAHAVEDAHPADEAPAPSPAMRWSCTVADLGPPEPGLHTARVRQWAGAVVQDMTG